MSEKPYLRERAPMPAPELRDEIARGRLWGEAVDALLSDGMTLARRTLNSPKGWGPSIATQA